MLSATHVSVWPETSVSVPRRQPTAFRGTGLRGGSIKSFLCTCKREQVGDDLRRAARDLVQDENLDDRTAPAHHLVFEIVALGPSATRGGPQQWNTAGPRGLAESLEFVLEEAMATCLGLEGCRGARARAGEELLRVRAQDGGSDIVTASQ